MPLIRRTSDWDATLNARGPEYDKVEYDTVVEVRTFDAGRNMSDTLDYTDWRTVSCTEALVYLGERGKENSWSEERHLEPHERFRWVDVCNHFAWRDGSDHVSATVDALTEQVKSDLAIYNAHQDSLARVAEGKRQARIAHDAAVRVAEIANRPARGKKMRVKSGRKVPVGTVGVVAFISGSGGVLLKDEATWQDRKANGVWIDPRHLEAC